MLGLLFILFAFVLLEKLYKIAIKSLEGNIVCTKRKDYATVIDKREFFISKTAKKYIIYLSCAFDNEFGKPVSVSEE